MNLKEIPLLVIAGPTAVGKTDLSIEIAKKYHGEVINGDSLQVYRHLNIGTGKITKEEQAGIPHHLIDILNPDENYDASRFKQMATEKIIDIYQRGKLPILVGGTGLYLEGLLYDLEFGGENSSDQTIRERYEQLLKLNGEQSLWEQLNQIDPEAAKKIPVNNTRRVIRALEMIEVTGELFSKQINHQQQIKQFNSLILVLNRSRERLYERINMRVEQMIQSGLEAEVRTIYNQFNGELINGMKGIGYKEWWPYFEGRQTIEEVQATIQQNSRRYAKRQLTWFRNRLSDTHWIDVDQMNRDYELLIEKYLIQERKNYD